LTPFAKQGDFPSSVFDRWITVRNGVKQIAGNEVQDFDAEGIKMRLSNVLFEEVLVEWLC
jgi:hypothetical protein